MSMVDKGVITHSHDHLVSTPEGEISTEKGHLWSTYNAITNVKVCLVFLPKIPILTVLTFKIGEQLSSLIHRASVDYYSVVPTFAL